MWLRAISRHDIVIEHPRSLIARLLIVSSITLGLWAASACPSMAQSFNLTASPTSLHAGAPLTVNWSATPVNNDWIGLYGVGDSDEQFIWWAYTGDSASGSFTVDAPSPAGQYEFRYFTNNTFQQAAVSNTVNSQIPGGYALFPSTSIVAPGSPIQVQWMAPMRDNIADWVGLFEVGDPNDQYISYQFTDGGTGGTMNFTMPAVPGDYEFRYLYHSGYTALTYSYRVRVDADAANYSLNVTPSSVVPGGTVTVSWTAPNGSSTLDWIGLFPEGEGDNHNFLWDHWFYTGGATSGSVSFTMPTTPGNYVFRYLVNNGWTHKAEFGVITVN